MDESPRKPIQVAASQVAHFITFSCVQHRRLFRHPDVFRIFLSQLESHCLTKRITIFGYVVMENHVHLFAAFPADLPPSRALQGLKRITSFKLLEWYRVHEPGVYKHLVAREGERITRRFYQPGGGFDQHVNYDVGALREILEYMHHNPVRAGIVTVPEAYPWSSASTWAGRPGGLVTVHSPFESDWPIVGHEADTRNSTLN